MHPTIRSASLLKAQQEGKAHSGAGYEQGKGRHLHLRPAPSSPRPHHFGSLATGLAQALGVCSPQAREPPGQAALSSGPGRTAPLRMPRSAEERSRQLRVVDTPQTPGQGLVRGTGVGQSPLRRGAPTSHTLTGSEASENLRSQALWPINNWSVSQACSQPRPPEEGRGRGGSGGGSVLGGEASGVSQQPEFRGWASRRVSSRSH